MAATDAHGGGSGQTGFTGSSEVPGVRDPGPTEGSRKVCPNKPPGPPRPEETVQVAMVEDAAEDPNSVWMKFVFSDDDSETLRTAPLNQAQVVTYPGLRPENEGNSVNGDLSGARWGREVLTRGEPVCPCADQFNEHGFASGTETYASQRATFGSSYTELASDSTFKNWCANPRQLDGGTAAISGIETAGGGLNDRTARDSKTRASMEPLDASFDTASVVVEAPQSLAGDGGGGKSFRFARPKLFVGKLSKPPEPDRPRAISPVTMSKKKRSRPKKRIHDGRANIKSIPVYNGDPIEEFDEADFGIQTRAEQSLFGALETE